MNDFVNFCNFFFANHCQPMVTCGDDDLGNSVKNAGLATLCATKNEISNFNPKN